MYEGEKVNLFCSLTFHSFVYWTENYSSPERLSLALDNIIKAENTE